MTLTISDVYDALSEKLGQKEAKVLVDYLEENSLHNENKIDKAIDQKILHLATKEDLAEVKLDLKMDIQALRTEIEKGLKEQLRWIIPLFVTLAIMILGLYATIIFK